MNFSSVLVPDTTPSGFAFCPTLTLPAYLQAVGIFVTVGVGLLPGKFAEVYKPDIERHASFLADIYTENLTEGYVFLPMPWNPWLPNMPLVSSTENTWRDGLALWPANAPPPGSGPIDYYWLSGFPS